MAVLEEEERETGNRERKRVERGEREREGLSAGKERDEVRGAIDGRDNRVNSGEKEGEGRL